MRLIAIAFALAFLLPGCSFLRSEGDESLRVRNSSGEPLTIVISITQHEGQMQLFGESMGLRSGEAREFALALRPGDHTVAITTSNRLQESLPIAIPDHGDTTIDVEVRRGSATITTTST